MKSYRIGWDIGSTTAKMVVLDADNGDLVPGLCQRRQTRVRECLDDLLRQLEARLGNIRFSACMTGTVGMAEASPSLSFKRLSRLPPSMPSPRRPSSLWRTAIPSKRPFFSAATLSPSSPRGERPSPSALPR